MRYVNMLLCFCAFFGVAIADVPGMSSVDLVAISSSQVVVDITPPVSDGGNAITAYKIDWDPEPGEQEVQKIVIKTNTGANEIQSLQITAPPTPETQTIQITATSVLDTQTVTVSGATAGSFKLRLDTTSSGGNVATSGDILYGASAGQVQEIITNMPNIQPYGSVIVTEINGAYQIQFPESMGNVPLLTAYNDLSPTGASADIAGVFEGNIIYGSFRLRLGDETTESIEYNALEGTVRDRLVALSGIETVDVLREGPDYQSGYTWHVTFTGALNGGNMPTLVAIYEDTLLMTTNQAGAQVVVTITSQDGNEIGGQFQVQWTHGGATVLSDVIDYDATAEAFKSAVEDMSNVGAGAISVSREGPDFQRGYKWTVAFLPEYTRSFEGNMEPFEFDFTSTTGIDVTGVVEEVRTGTMKEKQVITVSGVPLYETTMELSFRGETTIPIYVRPDNGTCASKVIERQTITTSTVDTTVHGGDEEVSKFLQMRLMYNNVLTQWIDLNSNADIDCSDTASEIKTQLETLHEFDQVGVSWSSISAAQDCEFTVDFLSSIGDIFPLKVQVQNTDTGAKGIISSSSVANDDTVTIVTVRDGQKDAIKAGLEQLSTVGTVTVTAETATQTPDGECAWEVVFDTAAGDLELLTATVGNHNFTNYTSDTYEGTKVEVSERTAGTSEVIGGNFAVSFRDERTLYLPYDADARSLKNRLEALNSIGEVEVERSPADENGGHTFTVKFLTELGFLPLMHVDQLDLTGTAVTSDVSHYLPGSMPLFDSRSRERLLPLGTATLTDLSNLQLTIDNLEEGIAYYVRCSAINAIGAGEFAYSSSAFAIPISQRPAMPENTMLTSVDGASINVAFEPPVLDGGEDITFYRIEQSTNAFISEVQEVSAECTVVNEVQQIATVTDQNTPETQLLYIETNYSDPTLALVNEKQTIVCDSDGGSFTFMFQGVATSNIPYNANADDIKARLQGLASINTVDVTFPGTQTTACATRTGTDDGFIVEFIDVVEMTGDIPELLYTTNALTGNRFFYVEELVKGAAPIGGNFFLSFRNSVTQAISGTFVDGTTNAANIEIALSRLDTITFGGVSVTHEQLSPGDDAQSEYHSQLYRITFTDPDLGGDIEPIQITEPIDCNSDCKITGSDVKMHIFTDAEETALERGLSNNPSVKGNEIQGTFKISYRGHVTEDIDFNAADTQMKARLEALPNIDLVDVLRTGPSVFNEYNWAITFLKLPGAYPDGTGNANMLMPVLEGDLLGVNSTVSITESSQGSDALAGDFILSVTTFDSGSLINVTETTAAIPADASASEVEAALNALSTIGTVSVARNTEVSGLKWLVTFDGCKIVNGMDVCNDGEIPLLIVDNSMMECGAAPVSVREVLKGSGAEKTVMFTDLSGTAPYNYVLEGLSAGTPYYVQVKAHNTRGYGYAAVSSPEALSPTYNAPDAPTPVHLISSTDSSITVGWEKPRENGGTPVTGYKLFVDDWAGGEVKLVYDGNSQPDVLEFTVTSTTSLVIVSGRSYRFSVQAINSCKYLDPGLACPSPLSDAVNFAARSPHASLAPTKLRRHSR